MASLPPSTPQATIPLAGDLGDHSHHIYSRHHAVVLVLEIVAMKQVPSRVAGPPHPIKSTSSPAQRAASILQHRGSRPGAGRLRGTLAGIATCSGCVTRHLSRLLDRLNDSRYTECCGVESTAPGCSPSRPTIARIVTHCLPPLSLRPNLHCDSSPSRYPADWSQRAGPEPVSTIIAESVAAERNWEIPRRRSGRPCRPLRRHAAAGRRDVDSPCR